MSHSLRPLLLLALCLPLHSVTRAAPAISPDQGEVAVTAQPSGLPANWADGPFMEIYVRGFRDSNGDGHGDLKGVIEKLDYLSHMGFTGIWLMPIFDSQDRNHGYAVRNYRKVESTFGSNDDVRLLAAEAHKRGIGLILDYIPNHSASAHPLFEAASEKISSYRDWYVWEEQKPEGWSGFTGEPWVARNNGWYYAVYDPIMPDFNWRTPAVMDFHLNNVRFWLNHGIDGLRLDAVGPLVENGPVAWQNQPQSLEITRRFSEVLKQYPGPTFQVCEAPGDVAAYADGCGSAFAFGLQTAIIKSVRLGRIDRDLVAYLDEKPVARLATFLSNHDTFAGVRLYKQLDGDLHDYRLAAATQYLLPGIPFTFYGEEIGLSMASSADGSDEQIRSIMPWTAEDTVIDANGKTLSTFGGFTALRAGRENRLFRPLPDNWKSSNVATQMADPDSLLNFYRSLIQLRKTNASLARGSYRRVTALSAGREQESTLVFVRELGAEQVLVAINYSGRDSRVSLPLKSARLSQLAGNQQKPRLAKGHLHLQLPAKGFAVYRVDDGRVP